MPPTPSPADVSPAFAALYQSVLHHLQQPSYPLPCDPATLVNLTLIPRLSSFISLPETHLLPHLLHLLTTSLPPHHLSVLSHHLHYHVDRLLCDTLSSHGFPSHPSIPHIVDDGDDDDTGGAHSIRGIAGGSLRLFPDAHTARVSALRQILYRTPASGVNPVLLLPSIPNAFPWLDRLLSDLALTPGHVRWVGVAPWVEVGGKEREGVKEPAEDGEHINPLVTHHVDLADLQAALTSLAQSVPRPSTVAFLTQLGSDWGAGDIVYYSEMLVKVKEVCRPHGVWLHVEGDLLWRDDDLDRRLAERETEDKRAAAAEKKSAKGKQAAGHAKRTSKPSITSTLYNCADSVVFTTAAFTSGSLAVSAVKALSRPAPTPSGGGGGARAGDEMIPHSFPVEVDDFAQLFRVWFDLTTAPSRATLLSGATSSVCQQLVGFRQALLSQSFSVYLIAPVGEQDGIEPSTAHPSLPVSHSHLFFQVSVSPPLTPAMFNLTVNQLNVYVAYCMYLRSFGHPTSQLAAYYGSVISPATYFDLKGFVYKPRPLSPTSPAPDLSSILAAIGDEIAVIEAAGRARDELEQLLSHEAEFTYIPLDQLQHSPRVGVGAFRFIPAQVPDGHVNELGRSLNRKLRALPSALQHPFPSTPFLPLSPPMAVSLFRPALTVKGQECTVIDVSPYLVTRGLAALWGDVKSVAAHLSLPKRVMADVSESVQRGIKEAEKKLDEVTANVYAPTNMVRWLPVVGSVVNYWMPSDHDAQAAPGQSYDLRKKELNVIRYSYQTQGPQGTPGKTGSTPTLPATSQLDRPVSALDLHSSPGAVRELTDAALLSATSSAAPVMQSHAPVAAPGAGAGTPQPPTVSTVTPPHSRTPSEGSVAATPTGRKKTISINIDEHERAILQTPLQPLPAVVAYLTKGILFTSYFPSPDAPAPASAPSAAASSPFISAELLIFYAPSYTGADAAEADLGTGPILAWCEPGQRYVSADQAIAIDHIHELFLGKKASFPQGVQGDVGQCMSILTPQVSLYLQADSKQTRDAFFLAIYALLQSLQQSQKKERKKTSNGKKKDVPGATTDTSAPTAPTSSTPPKSVSPAPSPRLTSVDQPMDLPSARHLLESGVPFIVYVLDKHNSEVTSKHEVTLWFKADVPSSTSATAQPQPPPSPSSGQVTGHLCWCRRGAHLDYSPSRSLPITPTVQICLGKQTKALRNAAAASCEGARAFSILCGRMILNLEAMSAEGRGMWLNAFHKVMTAAGKQRVFEEAQGKTAAAVKAVEGDAAA